MTPEAALTKLSYLLGRDDLTMKEKIEVAITHCICQSNHYYN